MWRLSVARLREVLSTSLWTVPTAFALAAALLSIVTQRLNEVVAGQPAFLFLGGPEGARSLLSAIVTSIMTFTGVVFSVTILVLQLASNQFSPRVMREFLTLRTTKVALGVFIGTFVYALLALRAVPADAGPTIPGIVTWTAVLLAFASVAAFVAYLHHIAQSIRAVNLLTLIGREGCRSLNTLYPEGVGEHGIDPPSGRPDGRADFLVCNTGEAGVVMHVDEEELWQAVVDYRGVVALIPMVGDFVAHGAPLFEVWGTGDGLDRRRLRETVTLGPERTVYQDLGFSFRQLVDIAERALSPSVNDPTTAVQALDQIHDLLRRLARRRFPEPFRADSAGRVKLVLARPNWDAYVRLGLDEIRLVSARSLQVYRRQRFLVLDLLTVVPRQRAKELRRQLSLLDAAVSRELDDETIRDAARTPSPQGHGPMPPSHAP